MAAFPITIFLSAFLLFQVQPVIARYILPWFGGTPAVWTTAMLFFQIMLLVGYLYSHILVTRLSPKGQVRVHLGLLALSILFLPITPDAGWKPTGEDAPMAQILLVLFATVSLPYVMVSATAPLIQAWFARSAPGRSPYRLYALSNAGSFLGLLSYPFVVEPLMGVTRQTEAWSVAYIGYILCAGWAGWTVLRRAEKTKDRPDPQPSAEHPRLTDQLFWLALAALGVVVLLAGTNQLSKDVAVIPLLWVVPLSLYLLSFVLSFGAARIYVRPLWAALMLISIAAALRLMYLDEGEHDVLLPTQIGIYSLLIFACCMVCHGELFRLKPAVGQLTRFYLMMSLGGAMGGVLVGVVAPVIFAGYWEFHLSLWACVLLLGLCWRRGLSAGRARLSVTALWAVCLLGLGSLFGQQIQRQQEAAITTQRSFFGVMRVYLAEDQEFGEKHSFYHGRIGHGDQYTDPAHRRLPIAYYGPNSGVGLALDSLRIHAGPELRIGVVGLGVATLAAYGQHGDNMRFYEIDPTVTGIAQDYFTYLSDSTAEIEIVHGDARISMEREARTASSEDRFDLLVIDAFSGDAIPLHLLTQEAMALYRDRLTSDGVLAMHVSNLYFDLRPVVQRQASEIEFSALYIEDLSDTRGTFPSDWMLVTRNSAVIHELRALTEELPEPEDQFLWTDDFADLLGALMLE